MNKNIDIKIGPGEAPLDLQLENQGYTYNPAELKEIQDNVAKAWSSYMDDTFSDDEYDFARRNILMALVRKVEEWNHVKINVQQIALAA